MLNHAVLYQDNDKQYHILFTSCVDLRVYNPVSSISNLNTTMVDHDIDCLWIMPTCEFSNVSPLFFESMNSDSWHKSVSAKEDTVMSVTFYRRGTGHYEKERRLFFPGNRQWCSDAHNRGYWLLYTPYDLLDTVMYICKELPDVDIIYGPGSVGLSLFKLLNKHHVLEPIQQQLPLSYIHQAVRDYEWIRKLMDYELCMMYVHCYDKNGQYNGAASSVSLGNGTPVHVAPDKYNKKSTALWHYRIRSVDNTEYNGVTLPCPLDKEKHLASTDLIQTAIDLGVDVEIVEGFLWEESGLYMRKWGETLWHGRSVFSQLSEEYSNNVARINAHYTFKQISNETIGKFRSQYSRELFRIDWGILVPQKARATITRTVEKYVKSHKIYPVVVRLDAIIIVSNEPDPALAVPGILQYKTEQRGYKHSRTVRLDNDIIEACNSGIAGLAERVIHSKENIYHG